MIKHTYHQLVMSQENAFVNVCSQRPSTRKTEKNKCDDLHILTSLLTPNSKYILKLIFVIVNLIIVMCYFSLNFLLIIYISKDKGILWKLIVSYQSVIEISINYYKELINYSSLDLIFSFYTIPIKPFIFLLML